MFTDNQALSYINTQEKLRNKHLKWMEYLKSFTFIIKHNKGKLKKVENALNRRIMIVQEIYLQSIGMEIFHNLYKEDEDISEAYKVCMYFENHFHRKFSKYTLQNGFLFKGN